MYYVYIIESLKNGRYYVGTTGDLKDRIKRHNAGEMKSTQPYIPYKIIHSESFPTLSEARKRESFIKSKKSRKFIEKLRRVG
ncbi:MAG: GIY-YIG nuclease family protein [Candidatus Margulisbacteria bacterium]|nr:GIY-YIG nuclease family protein [Candidatus Margulisiibacteriota bacterium]